MKWVELAGGERVPALGMGTWELGDRPAARRDEIACLQHGVDLGMSLIDTAEMYGDGASEQLVGEAIAGRRERVFLVTKVYPQNATRRGAIAACERSLKRLATDRLDLYLLHWRGNVPFAETIAAFEQLQRDGKIRYWGVSNLDTRAQQDWVATPGGAAVAANQVLYNLSRRGVEWSLLPWCRAQGIALMAYSPVEQARLLDHRELIALARELGRTPAQLALAWLLAREGVIAIPKAARRKHLDDNFGALETPLDTTTLTRLDAIFPPPRREGPLEMI
jgi:diketogulonate reductase-like aldo/keto reductase